jgi:hypothetical protein
MIDEWAILEKLNNDDNDFLSDGDVLTIMGVEFNYSESSDMHDNKVTSSLSSELYTFEREGRKEISYERWIDTSWWDWE